MFCKCGHLQTGSVCELAWEWKPSILLLMALPYTLAEAVCPASVRCFFFFFFSALHKSSAHETGSGSVSRFHGSPLLRPCRALGASYADH